MSYRVVKHVLAIDPVKLPESHKRFVLTVLAEHADPDGSNAFPALPRIAQQTGLSEDAVYRWRRELREEGWITVTRRTRYYTVHALNMAKIEAAKYDPDSATAQSLSDDPDSALAQSPGSATAQSLTLHQRGSDSALAQSNSSYTRPDSSEDSPTPPGVCVRVQSEPLETPKTETEDEGPTYTIEEMFAWFLNDLHRGTNATAITKKTMTTVARLVRALNDGDYYPWEIVSVVDWCRRAQAKQPTRFLLKNLRAILQEENFDMLYGDADKQMLLTEQEITRLTDMDRLTRMEATRNLAWGRRFAKFPLTAEWLESQITEAIETAQQENAA